MLVDLVAKGLCPRRAIAEQAAAGRALALAFPGARALVLPRASQQSLGRLDAVATKRADHGRACDGWSGEGAKVWAGLAAGV